MKTVDIFDMIPIELNQIILDEFKENDFELVRNSGASPSILDSETTCHLYFSFKKGKRSTRFTLTRDITRKRNSVMVQHKYTIHSSDPARTHSVKEYIRFVSGNPNSEFRMEIDIPTYAKMEETKVIANKEMVEGRRVNEFKTQLLLPFIEGQITSAGFKLAGTAVADKKNLRRSFTGTKMSGNIEMVQLKYAKLAETEIEDTLIDVYLTMERANIICVRMKSSDLNSFLEEAKKQYSDVIASLGVNEERIDSVKIEISKCQSELDILRNSISKDIQAVKNAGQTATSKLKESFKNGTVQHGFWRY